MIKHKVIFKNLYKYFVEDATALPNILKKDIVGYLINQVGHAMLYVLMSPTSTYLHTVRARHNVSCITQLKIIPC